MRQSEAAIPIKGALSEPDPILELIQRSLDLEAAFQRVAAENDDTSLDAIVHEQCRVRVELSETAPTTLDGLAALASFLNRHSHVTMENVAFFDGEQEHLAFYASLDRALASITGSRSAG
jgi:hypothetical protein